MQNRQWIESIKLAIINEKIDDIIEYSKSIPSFDDLKQMQTAQALIKQASEIIKKEQDKLNIEMQKIKQIKSFLN